MKLEEAITWLNNLFFDFKDLWNTYTLTEEDLDAAHTLISHAESTRWRKLTDEEPTKQEYYEVSDGDGFSKAIWIDEEQGMSASDDDAIVTIWWRPILGPEEEQ